MKRREGKAGDTPALTSIDFLVSSSSGPLASSPLSLVRASALPLALFGGRGEFPRCLKRLRPRFGLQRPARHHLLTPHHRGQQEQSSSHRTTQGPRRRRSYWSPTSLACDMRTTALA